MDRGTVTLSMDPVYLKHYKDILKEVLCIHKASEVMSVVSITVHTFS